MSNVADMIEALLDTHDHLYPPGVPRFYSREKARAIIKAALWAYSARSDSTAGAYAAIDLFTALGLKDWTFEEEEAAVLRKHREAIISKMAGPG